MKLLAIILLIATASLASDRAQENAEHGIQRQAILAVIDRTADLSKRSELIFFIDDNLIKTSLSSKNKKVTIYSKSKLTGIPEQNTSDRGALYYKVNVTSCEVWPDKASVVILTYSGPESSSSWMVLLVKSAKEWMIDSVNILSRS